MKRRGFLGLLGLAPFGAKAAADDALVQMGFQHGSKVLSAAAPILSNQVAYDGPGEMPCTAPDSGSWVEKMIANSRKALKFLNKDGLPAWKRAEIAHRELNTPRHGLDPDLAVLVSVSPGWKARRQRQRNIARAEAMAVRAISIYADRAAWQQKHGLEWYD